jgi:hypothetical protein
MSGPAIIFPALKPKMLQFGCSTAKIVRKRREGGTESDIEMKFSKSVDVRVYDSLHE